ncbi:MAG TPA: dicarboxylate/amino acid:cation symporter [Humisphaera sp.]
MSDPANATKPPEPLDYQPNDDADAQDAGGFLARTGRALAAAFAFYDRVPLYLRILVGLVLGVAVGTAMLMSQAAAPKFVGDTAGVLDTISKLVIQFLAALAPPLILLAVVRALMTARIEGRQGAYMVFLLILNTLAAIFIGLLVANVVRPGKHAEGSVTAPDKLPQTDIVKQLLDNIPSSLVEPFVSGRVIAVVILALAFGFAARALEGRRRQVVEDLVEAGFEMVITVLHWVIWLVPIAVFAKVAAILGLKGFKPFVALGAFVLAVILALLLQAGWYLGRIRWRSWVRPGHLLRNTRDALVMAFSTGSSTATMPVTYQRLRHGVGLRERSASLGALVGSNFNNDGTALYEAMAALFVAQMLGIELSLWQQVMVVLTSVIASVGAAGIPEAGLVTMTLVFTAVDLPPAFIPFLLPVDWFLDRCRTAINVMGDMNVSCLLDGKEREEKAAEPAAVAATPA